MNRKIFYALGILLFLVVGLAASLVLVRRQQDIRSKATGCDGRWPADPATACGQATQAPAQGATNVSLTPNFHWDYGGYRPGETGCVEPSGCSSYSATVYLSEGSAASKPFARADIATQTTPVKDAPFANFYLCDYGHVFPNDPDTCHTDSQPKLTTLKTNTTYFWRPTPFFDSIVHAEQTWNYSFATGTTPPPAGPTCNSLTMTPTGTVVAVGSETRSLTANATGGSENLTYNWTTTGGTLSATAGQTVTWTAPASLGTTAQSWIISATVTDGLGQVSSVGGCTTTLVFTPTEKAGCNQSCAVDSDCDTGFCYTDNPPPGMKRPTILVCRNRACSSETSCVCPSIVAACQKVEADKDLTKINIGDTVNFTGWGTLNASSTDVIDKIEFTLTGSTKAEVPATLDRTENNIKYFKAVKSFLINAAGSYSMKIRIHQRDADRWYE